MERYYDGDQDRFFAEAKVMNPFKCHIHKTIRLKSHIKKSNLEECDICLSRQLKTVSFF